MNRNNILKDYRLQLTGFTLFGRAGKVEGERGALEAPATVERVYGTSKHFKQKPPNLIHQL